MQQLTYNAPQKGAVKTPILITGKDKAQQQKLSAAALAEQLGMEFPQQGLPVVMDDGEPVAKIAATFCVVCSERTQIAALWL